MILIRTITGSWHCFEFIIEHVKGSNPDIIGNKKCVNGYLLRGNRIEINVAEYPKYIKNSIPRVS